MQSEKSRSLDSELKSILLIFGYAALIGVPIAYLGGILTFLQFSLLEIFFILSLISATSAFFRIWKVEELKTNKLYRLAGFIMLFVCIPLATIFDLLMSVYMFSSILNPNEPNVITGHIEVISMAMDFFIIMGFLIAIIMALAIYIHKKKHS